MTKIYTTQCWNVFGITDYDAEIQPDGTAIVKSPAGQTMKIKKRYYYLSLEEAKQKIAQLLGKALKRCRNKIAGIEQKMAYMLEAANTYPKE